MSPAEFLEQANAVRRAKRYGRMKETANIRIALLRAVNLGPKSTVAMSDLREMVGALGFADPRTLLASGNVVFRASAPPGDLETLLAAQLAKRLGLHTDVLVRTAAEWREIVARNPFADEAEDDPSHLLVMLLKDAPAVAEVRALQASIAGPEVVRVVGRHAYITYPAGIGRSRLTAAVIEKAFGARGTGRNWNTVLKIAALAES
jgi:uncharacterized protein (DUF1697 family)